MFMLAESSGSLRGIRILVDYCLINKMYILCRLHNNIFIMTVNHPFKILKTVFYFRIPEGFWRCSRDPLRICWKIGCGYVGDIDLLQISSNRYFLIDVIDLRILTSFPCKHLAKLGLSKSSCFCTYLRVEVN